MIVRRYVLTYFVEITYILTCSNSGIATRGGGGGKRSNLPPPNRRTGNPSRSMQIRGDFGTEKLGVKLKLDSRQSISSEMRTIHGKNCSAQIKNFGRLRRVKLTYYHADSDYANVLNGYVLID